MVRPAQQLSVFSSPHFPKIGALLLFALFGLLITPYFSLTTGFTSLIHIGEKLGPGTESLRETPHYVHRDSSGYDGMFYAQLALEPSLADPQLGNHIDNLPYRARRMLMSWSAYVLGVGQPFWVLQAYALINIVAWLFLAVVLWRWLPPDTWGNWFRWAGILFSQGVAMSVHLALPDLPALVLVLLALLMIERQREKTGMVFLAASALCKETSLLSGLLLLRKRPQGAADWCLLALKGALIVFPLAAWLLYLRYGLGLLGNAGDRNFSWPLSGIAARWVELVGDLVHGGDFLFLKIGTVLTLLALMIQAGYLLLRWQPANLWWRLGVPFAALALFVSNAVWEGYPGAASRVLLPMAIAFNLLVPKGRRWLVILVLGNLSVFSAFLELRTTPVHFVQARGGETLFSPVWESRSEGWYGDEEAGAHRWRWAGGAASITFLNTSERSATLRLEGSLASETERELKILAGDRVVWQGTLPGGKRLRFSSEAFAVPSGELSVRFLPAGDARPATLHDARCLSFRLEDPVLCFTVKP